MDWLQYRGHIQHCQLRERRYEQKILRERVYECLWKYWWLRQRAPGTKLLHRE